MSIVENKNTAWACMRDPQSHLVWWVHSKCACSFYKVIFNELGWVQSTTHDIDWQTAKVFSHIREPLVKHRMGIIEWFFFNHKQSLLTQNFNNSEFFQLLSEVVHIDVHSMSVREHLGQENSQKVHWIAIDTGHNHVQETIDFIQNTKSRNLFQRLIKKLIHILGFWGFGEIGRAHV